MGESNPFAGRRTRVLGMEEVRKLLDIKDGIDIQRHAFLHAARGDTVSAPNSWLRLPGDRRGWLKILAGYDHPMRALGVKVLARFPDNPPGANLGSILMLIDDDDGFPLAIMEASYVTAIRTGAGAALATAALARSGQSRSRGHWGGGVVLAGRGDARAPRSERAARLFAIEATQGSFRRSGARRAGHGGEARRHGRGCRVGGRRSNHRYQFAATRAPSRSR